MNILATFGLPPAVIRMKARQAEREERVILRERLTFMESVAAQHRADMEAMMKRVRVDEVVGPPTEILQ
jgi:cephalosporin-C deacetylase-like acetyl esterase